MNKVYPTARLVLVKQGGVRVPVPVGDCMSVSVRNLKLRDEIEL